MDHKDGSKDGQSGTWMVWDPFKPKQFFSGLIVDSDFRLKAGPPSSRRSSSWSKRRAAGGWPKDCPHASFPPRPPPSSWSSATRRWRSWVCGPSWLIRGTGNRPVRRGIVCHFPGGTLKGRWMVRFYSETVREQNQTKWVFVFLFNSFLLSWIICWFMWSCSAARGAKTKTQLSEIFHWSDTENMKAKILIHFCLFERFCTADKGTCVTCLCDSCGYRSNLPFLIFSQNRGYVRIPSLLLKSIRCGTI